MIKSIYKYIEFTTIYTKNLNPNPWPAGWHLGYRHHDFPRRWAFICFGQAGRNEVRKPGTSFHKLQKQAKNQNKAKHLKQTCMEVMEVMEVMERFAKEENSREPLVQWSSMLARHRNSSEASSLRDLRCEIFKSRWDESEPGVPMPSKNPQNRCRMRSSLGRSLWGARPRTVIQFIVHESRQTRQSPLYFCFFYFFDLTISWVLDVRSFRLQVCQWNWVFFQLSSFVSLEIEIASRVSWAAVKTAERVPRSTWNGCSANWKDLQGVSDMEHGGKTMENIGCANSRGERCENPGRFTWTAGRIVMIVLWWMLETQTVKSLKQWKTLWASMS